MKTTRHSSKSRKNRQAGKPFDVVKIGSVSVPIYCNTNIIPQRDADGKIIYAESKSDDKKQALVKYTSDIFTVVYYEGNRRVRLKFSKLEKAQKEAEQVAIKLAHGESEALKLNGGDRADYVRAMQKLREWRTDIDLNLAITDYIAAMRRLPTTASLKEVVDFYLKRQPLGLPQKTVQEVVNDLVEVKEKAGKSEIYLKELRRRLGHFGKAFNLWISLVTGKQVEDYIRGLGVSGRTQNNHRQLINTLFRFAIKRGYLPKDHDEISSVELAEHDSGEIEVFTPSELKKLFNACLTQVQERGKWRDREAMIPYLAIAAFCGLRSAEIARLDWSEIHLAGAEHFIEVKASKAKTASRRTVPIPANCASWLAPFVRTSGPVCSFERPDKQCFQYLGPAAGLEWKHNGLRHSFISYRLAQIKNVHQVSLEAGNSPQMVFKHYRQLVSETQATEWFGIVPPENWKNIVPMPKEGAEKQDAVDRAGAV